MPQTPAPPSASLTVHQIRSQIRTSITQRLPEAIEQAMESYMRFADGGLAKQPTAEEKKRIPSIEYDRVEFKAHHDACRVAIAHINLLLDLAKDLLAEEQSAEDNMEAVNTLSLAVQKARAEIASTQTRTKA